MQENKYLDTAEYDSIDVIALLKYFWLARNMIFRITLLFLFLGVFIAVFSKKEYTASTTFVPLVKGKSSGGLGSLASLAGISIGGGVSSSEISPELYPKIVGSYPYQKELLNAQLTIDGQENSVTYKKYYEEIYNPGVLAFLKKYTVGLPSVIISLFKSDSKVIELDEGIEGGKIFNISRKDYALINKLSKQIKLDINRKEGFITISTTMEEPLASAELTLKAQEILQKYALKFKTQKSTEELDYIKARYLEKEKEFNAAKINLARFQDRNSGINTALGKTRLFKLQSDYNITLAIYTDLAKQLEFQLLQVKKDTPLFMVLAPVTIPLVKSSSSRVIIVILFSLLGFVLSVFYVFFKKYFLIFKNKWIAEI